MAMGQLDIEYAEYFFYCLSTVLMLMWVSVYSWQRKTNIHLYVELDAIIEKRSKNAAIKAIYDRTSMKIDDLMKLVYFMMMQILLPIVAISYILMPIFKFVLCDYSTNNLLRGMFPAFLPFDSKTSIGFLISCLIQIVTSLAAAELFMATFIIVIGHRFVQSDFALDFQHNLKQLNKEMSTDDDKFPIEMKENFIQSVEFYAEANKFRRHFWATNKYIIFVYFLYTITSFGGFMLQIFKILLTGNMFGVFQILVPSSIAVFWGYFILNFQNIQTN